MGWVTDRYRCTLDVAFEQLREVVGRDIDEANGFLSEPRRKVAPFGVSDQMRPGGEGRFVVRGFPIDADTPSNQYTYWFELGEDQILIRRTGPDTLPKLSDMTITQRWDADTASCLLFLGDRKVSVEAISQIALEPMFFGAAT